MGNASALSPANVSTTGTREGAVACAWRRDSHAELRPYRLRRRRYDRDIAPSRQRRRHISFGESFSNRESDVAPEYLPATASGRYPTGRGEFVSEDADDQAGIAVSKANGLLLPISARGAALRLPPQIGRASCRERGEVGAGSVS